MEFTPKELIEKEKEILRAIKSPIVKEAFEKYMNKLKEKEEFK